ncbi:MAG: hypothetical protein EGR26_06145 [Clostridiales bacterium]|nr:hypothetical protein [Clostridiales bacterium]
MRIIDADALEKKLNERYDYLLNENGPYDHFTDGYEEAVSTVEDFPTVDAEVVVRCKDCKHYDMGVCLKIYSDGNVHPEAWQSRKPEDFCSYGERREAKT